MPQKTYELQKSRRMNSNRQLGRKVDVGIVIPTRDRMEFLERLLLSIRRQSPTARPDLNLATVVVDDGSMVGVRLPHFPEVEIVRLPGQGPAVARNVGARTVGDVDYLLFLDDDCLLKESFFEESCAYLIERSADIIVPKIESHEAVRRHFLVKYLQWRNFQQVVYGKGNCILCIPSAALLVKSEVFRSIGGFPAEISWPGGEDDIFSRRAISAGASIQICPRSVVFHQDPTHILGILKRWYNYGRGHAATTRLLGLPPEAYNLPRREYSRMGLAGAVVNSLRGSVWKKFRSREYVSWKLLALYVLLDFILEVARQLGASGLPDGPVGAGIKSKHV